MNMFEKWKQRLEWRRDLTLPHGSRIKKWGHRAYVGAVDSETWYGIGKRQYHFLVSEGLTARHKFLDVACGSLRLGQFLIPMLGTGAYFGLEGEPELVEAGLKHELLYGIISQKKPVFAFNYDFDVSTFESFDYAMAQSLFTHLTLEDIEKCFRNLRAKAHAGSRLYATFFEGASASNPKGESHANKDWYYQFSQIEEIAVESGWRLAYIGDWGHERGQKMIRATIDGA